MAERHPDNPRQPVLGTSSVLPDLDDELANSQDFNINIKTERRDSDTEASPEASPEASAEALPGGPGGPPPKKKKKVEIRVVKDITWRETGRGL